MSEKYEFGWSKEKVNKMMRVCVCVCVCVCVRVNIPEGAAAPNENAFEAGAAAGAVVEKPPKPPAVKNSE